MNDETIREHLKTQLTNDFNLLRRVMAIQSALVLKGVLTMEEIEAANKFVDHHMPHVEDVTRQA